MAGMLLGASSTRAQIDFTASRVFEIPLPWPARGAAGDFDGDGRPDLVAIFSGLGVGVLRNDPRSGFLPLGTVPVHGSGGDLITADFGGDGDLDVLFVPDRGDVSLFSGDGSGALAAAAVAPTTGSNGDAVVADFDGDGLADVAVLSGSIRLIPGLAGDLLAPAIATGIFFRPAAVADVDEDGVPDMVGEGQNQKSAWLRGLGGFAFDPPRPIGDRGDPRLAVSDFDLDGHADVAEIADGVLRVYRGDGAGAFAPFGTDFFSTANTDVTAADFDGDGDADLVVWPVVYLNRGGPFRRDDVLPFLYYDTDAFADFDQDGWLDAPVPWFGRVRLVSGFPGASARGVPGDLYGTFPVTVAVADWNGDGHSDIARASRFYSGTSREPFVDLRIELGDPRATFAESREFDLALDDAHFPLAADFDLDGDVDLALLDPPRRVVSVLAGDGRGSFGSVREFSGAGNVALAAADFDEDGVLDLATASSEAPSVRVSTGDGRGRFVPPIGFATDGTPSSLVVADVDEDGHDDLVSGNGDVAALSILRGDGRAGFAPLPAIDLEGRFAASVEAADVDGDGHVDLALALADAAGAPLERSLLLFGAGDGSFPRRASVESTDPIVHLLPLDLDEDGRIDLAGARTEREFFVRLADGKGGFGEPLLFAPLTFGPIGRVVAADLDGDGHADLTSDTTANGDTPLLFSRSFDPGFAARGEVNRGAGALVDVLFVNGSAGSGPLREIAADRAAPFEVRVAAPPSRPFGPAPFVLYAWPSLVPSAETVRQNPFGLGASVAPMPFGVRPAPRPREIWNNVGKEARLGAPTRPSTPAPSIVLSLPAGPGRAARATLQGVVRDRGARNGRAAITNSVTVEFR